MWWWWGPPVLTLAIIFTGLFLMSISLDKYANPRLKGTARG
jgi:ABC-type dipeptide/oligopeptide/nickel transport system permease subunit